MCDKSGLNNAILKEKVKSLIQKLFSLYDAKKTVALIIKFGAGAKNLKSVAECLDCLASYIREKGVDQFTEKDIQNIAKLGDSNDKGVREGSLHVLAEVHKILDEDIWRVVGNVSIKVKGLLEARFKQLNKGGASSTNLMTGSIRS